MRRALERLGEEIGRVLRSGHVGDLELERLDHVAHEEVSSLDVLHAVVVLRVVRDVARALAISGELGRIGRARALRTDAPINESTFSTVNKSSQLDISINRMIHFDFSSDLISGGPPMSKSDEKSKCIILLIDIWPPHMFNFSKKVASFSELYPMVVD